MGTPRIAGVRRVVPAAVAATVGPILAGRGAVGEPDPSRPALKPAGASRAMPQARPGEPFAVQPYYVYPRDTRYHAEYEAAIRKLIPEVQAWYLREAGVTFRVLPLKIIKAPNDFRTMRGGNAEKGKLDPGWLPSIEKAVGGFKDRQVAWVFCQGGGGWAGGFLGGDHRGFALFGDWVLEPISGVRDEALNTCAEATWQCEAGVPIGTTVHEIGHAFGLHHPDNYPGKSIMKWHGDYPKTALLAHEKKLVRNSPFFSKNTYDADGAPLVGIGETTDVAYWGEPLAIKGKGFRAGDRVEFTDALTAVEVTPEAGSITAEAITVKVPRDLGPGFVRVLRPGADGKAARKRSNIVPLNVYAYRPAPKEAGT